MTTIPDRPPSPALPPATGLRPGVLTGLFVAGGVAWILAGEWLAVRAFGEPPAVVRLQLVKGLLFVAAAGGWLYVLLRWRERTLAETREALRYSRGMASLGTLVLAVAHQLKNPLFAMSAALDAFEQRAGDDPGTARHRTILRQQAEKIRLLVTALQEYGQIGEPRRRPVDVGGLVGRVAADWRGRADAAGARLEVDAPAAGELTAELDPEALGRALHRLLENALQHGAAGGVVTLSARPAADRRELELAVGDAGPGFRPDDLPRATSPLFSRQPGGAGLGLAVAERIAELHGGRLELGRSDRGGARVSLHLPL